MSELADRAGMIGPNDLLQLRFVRDARLSPDGSKVAYAISRTVECADAEYCELWVHDLQTAELCAIDIGDVFSTAPRWSPSGERLAYVSTGAAGSRICVFALADGST